MELERKEARRLDREATGNHAHHAIVARTHQNMDGPTKNTLGKEINKV